MIITKQILRDKIYFLGATSLKGLAESCKIDSKADLSLFRSLLVSMVNQGLIVENRGLYSCQIGFKLKGENK